MNPWKQAGIPLVVSVVTTIRPDGKVNASPKSWWTPTSYDPARFVVAVKPESDTYRNIEETGLLALHVPPTHTEDFTKQILHTAKPLPYGECELDDVGLGYSISEHPEMSTVKFAAIDGVPYFGGMVASKLVSGDHVLYEAQVVLTAMTETGDGIGSVMLHRGMNRFVSIGKQYEVERY